LIHHGLDGLCPTVCPAMLLPDVASDSYLHVQERGGRPANKWKVAIFDTGADVPLCSKAFADANGLEYGVNPIGVNAANGQQTQTLGELSRPLEFTLCRGSDHACTAVAVVQVMDVGSDLYDLIISMNIITQWGAYVDTTTSQLVYHPDFWSRRSRKRTSKLPILTSPPEPAPKSASQTPRLSDSRSTASTSSAAASTSSKPPESFRTVSYKRGRASQ
jgi:hypothetical protein